MNLKASTRIKGAAWIANAIVDYARFDAGIVELFPKWPEKPMDAKQSEVQAVQGCDHNTASY